MVAYFKNEQCTKDTLTNDGKNNNSKDPNYMPKQL